MLKTTFFGGDEIRESKHYESILFGPRKLHLSGALFRVLKNPQIFPPTTIVLTEEHDIPISVVSLTYNAPESKSLLCAPSFATDNIPIVFPSYEIMAFTDPLKREKGITKKAVQNLIERNKVKPYEQIYVYSRRMESMLRGLGFKANNLHYYTF